MLLGRRLGALGAASPRPAARPLGAARPLATPAAAAPAGRVVGGANLDWGRLPFNYHETAAVVRYEWADGVWDAGTEHADPHVKVHLLSHIINFGQGCFEGLKVFHTQDGRVVAFNPTCNARRLQSSAARLSLPQVPEELFLEGVERAIRANLEYVPPYGSGGAMYVRPVLFGHGAEMHLVAPPRATFAVAATPVGPFFPREAGLKPVSALVVTDYDRAATRGTGRYKVGGNYSPDMLVSGRTRSKGFDVSLFLDSATQSYVDEFSVANFVGISKEGALVTPQSDSILPSCTKGVVMRVAERLGLRVEQRPLPWSEALTLSEAAACGTAVVLTPMASLTREADPEGRWPHEEVRFKGHGTIQRLYDHVVALQLGEEEDPDGLLHEVHV